MNEPLRVAVVGSGYFSRFHYEAWQRLESVELVACLSRDPAQAKATAEHHGVPAHYSDLETMIAEEAPDLIDLVVPPAAHLELIRAAARPGVTLICQKPFCRDLEEARAATALAEAAGATLIVHENFRFQPWYREAKLLLDAGALGEPYQASFRLRPGDGQGPEAYLARQPYFQKMPRFLIRETGIHLVDTFRFLLGEVAGVFARLKRLNPAIAGEDAGLVLFDFEGGARGLFDGNRLAGHAAENPRLTLGEFWLDGSEATLRLDGRGRLFLLPRDAGEEGEHSYAWRNEGFAGDCVHALQAHVVEALLAGRTPENRAADYLANLAVEEAIYRSAESGCWEAPDGRR